MFEFRVNFNIEKDSLPLLTMKRLEKGGCNKKDFENFPNLLAAAGLAPLQCQFPLPKNNNRTRDVMYVRCQTDSKERGDRESNKEKFESG